MATFQTKVEDCIECPVCFNIPRSLPIPSCRAGHVVCRPCSTRMSHCPICRHSLNYVNTIVGYLVQIVLHKCSYRVFGCNVVTSMHDIIEHELGCTERIVQCPFRDCNKSIQLKNFEHHAVATECAVDLHNLDNYDNEPGVDAQS